MNNVFLGKVCRLVRDKRSLLEKLFAKVQYYFETQVYFLKNFDFIDKNSTRHILLNSLFKK